ncbi:DUF5956 family protein [Streptomyces goshikiensis]
MGRGRAPAPARPAPDRPQRAGARPAAGGPGAGGARLGARPGGAGLGVPALRLAPADRTWIPDRSTHWAVDTRLDGHGHVTGVEATPLAEAELHDLDRETEELLDALGLPHRPPGRLWLLRPIGPYPAVGAVLDHLRSVARERGIEFRASPELLSLTRAELATLTGSGPP